MADTVSVLGTRLHRVTFAQAVAQVEQLVSTDAFSLVVTPNPEIIMRARREAELRGILNGADLAVADGVGVVWASKVLGVPVPERIPGIELMMALVELASRNALRVYLLGTRPATIEAAARRLQAQHPGLAMAGYHHGYFGRDEEGDVVNDIVVARPDLLFVGMGAPREQFFLDRWRDDLGSMTALGVGGSFDVLSGEKNRAPHWAQRLGVEWLYRLVTEPQRFRRQAGALPAFVVAVLAARMELASSGGRLS